METIFLTPMPEMNDARLKLLEAILHRAGFKVLPASRNGNNAELLTNSESALKECRAMILILSDQYGPTVDSANLVSFSRYFFKIGLERSRTEPDFRFFIWHVPELMNLEIDIFQQEFINEIRYSLNPNMVFSGVSSPIQFVEDLRSMMEEKTVTSFNVKNSDIFLIFNEVDEEEANDIIELLSDVINIEKLNIVQSKDMDYAELCSQQITNSKLAVVYFKETADWALPFTQQIWKKVGGAASHTPILLIGDEDPSTNIGKKFTAPKIISLITAGDLLPLEIKVQYDKITTQ